MEDLMMSCRRLIDSLADYVAVTLEDRERGAFEAHLAHCHTCVDYLRGYRETIRLTKNACAPSDDAAQAMPAALVDAILAASTTPRSR
jgi:anti-sigma factor RsiW